MLFLTVSEQKGKVNLISEFSYLALVEIRKLGNLGKMNYLNFICTCDLQWLQLFSCFSILFQSKSVKLG